MRVSRKQFGFIAPDGWSDSDTIFVKNDVKTVNTKRLSLSVASDSKCFIRDKTNDIKEAKKLNPPIITKRNTNWAVKTSKLGGDGIIVLQKSKMRCVLKMREQLATFLLISISIGLSVSIGS